MYILILNTIVVLQRNNIQQYISRILL